MIARISNKEKKRKGLILLKVVLIITALLSSLFSFTGCKSDKKTTLPKSSSKISNAVIDFKGGDIKISLFRNETSEDSKLEDEYKQNRYFGSERITENLLKTQSKYNCKIVYAGCSNAELHNSILKGEPIAQLMFLGGNITENIILGKDSFLSSLDQYSEILELDNPDIWDLNLQKAMTFGGDTQLVYTTQKNNNVYMNSQLLFNKTMLEENGLWGKYNLYEMQKNKTWTWDVFKNLCEEITADTNNDGKVDRYGIYYKGIEMFNNIAVSNGSSDNNSTLITLDMNGDALLAINEPAQKGTLDFMISLIDAGYMKYTEDAKDGSFYQGNSLFELGEPIMIKMFKDSLKDKLGVVAFPLGPNNTSKEYNSLNSNYFGMGIIKNTKNPKDLAYLVRDFSTPPFTEEEFDAYMSDYLQVDVGLSNEDIETCKISLTESMNIDMSRLFTQSYEFYSKISEVLSKKISKDELLEKIAPAIQSDISKYWDKVKIGLKEL